MLRLLLKFLIVQTFVSLKYMTMGKLQIQDCLYNSWGFWLWEIWTFYSSALWCLYLSKVWV